MEEYPSKLLFSTVLTLCTVVQSLVVALIFERDYGRWMLSFNIDLLAVDFSVTNCRTHDIELFYYS
ncbi:hypothetical protein QJS04_geneDACA008653 [Acorus gramineus]|uniref:Uncharacterized protein n=1 Tax=Acorus gramineus TaxID=55184 RepID=A0AAV9AJ30_ACOGR|nr:hypothetical protein QJS04_geneDACA008653 [Acorus gramineus]